MSDLYKMINYTQSLDLLKSVSIYEYDIRKANISVLLNQGVISPSYYDYLFKQDNMIRKVIIGKLERQDSNITRKKQQGIEDAKKYLFEANDIKDYEVISIKNDAVFVTRELTNLKYGHAEFTLRNIYTLYLKVFTCELYYYYDKVNDIEVLDIKGINDEVLELHKNYMLDFLQELLSIYQQQGCTKAILLLKGFYKAYMNRELDLEFYRDLKTGEFLLDTDSSMYDYYSIIPNDKIRSSVSLSNNGAFLREIAKILYEDYNRTRL